ncbi:MAG: ABC transporter ATP-binding protein [Anaerococcus sp.]
MIEVQNLSKIYENSKVAVDDISFKVKGGEIFGFLGPNGAGKSTTIKSIVGIIKKTKGAITINDLSLEKNPLEYKKQFSYVPDNPELFDKLTGNDYINFISDIYELDDDTRKQRLEKYLGIFDIRDAMDQQISTYSHGMQQKLALIGALIHEPEVFILDEPMVGLDPKSSFNLKEHMRERANAGKTVFFSTHVMEVAENICDRIAIISNGKIVALGTMEELHERSHNEGSLESLFLELTKNE